MYSEDGESDQRSSHKRKQQQQAKKKKISENEGEKEKVKCFHGKYVIAVAALNNKLSIHFQSVFGK